VVEVPPGPPVLATLLAEIYGPDANTRLAVAEQVKALFRSVPYIVDVSDAYGHPRPRLRVIPTRIKKDSSAGEKSHDSMAIEKPGRSGFKRAGISIDQDELEYCWTRGQPGSSRSC
jgi:hypothetical protein